MRISDWGSDVCSSDLLLRGVERVASHLSRQRGGDGEALLAEAETVKIGQAETPLLELRTWCLIGQARQVVQSAKFLTPTRISHAERNQPAEARRGIDHVEIQHTHRPQTNVQPLTAKPPF